MSGGGARARLRALLYVVAVLGAAAVALATSSGPDVTVLSLTDVRHYTTSGPVDGYRAYSIGTDACNVGDQPVWWCNGNTAYCSDEQHPVIAQNRTSIASRRAASSRSG